MDYHGLSYVWPGLSWIIMDYHMFGQDYHGLSWIIICLARIIMDYHGLSWIIPSYIDPSYNLGRVSLLRLGYLGI